METLKLKNEKGISMITLITTIVLMLIIATVIVYNSRTSLNLDKLDKMYADIQTLQDKVDIYYAENKKLPIETNPSDTITLKEGTDKIFGIPVSKNDGNTYSKISDSFTDDLNLNYDTDYYINLESHIIYSADGVNIDNNQYHTANKTYDQIDNYSNFFTITFDYLDDNIENNIIDNIPKGNSNIDFKNNPQIAEFSSITKEDGSNIKGWTLNKYGVGDLIDNLTISGDVTVYAVWNNVQTSLSEIKLKQYLYETNTFSGDGARGEEYHGDWTNKNIYHEITIDGDNNVDHYQYTFDKTKGEWNNIKDSSSNNSFSTDEGNNYYIIGANIGETKNIEKYYIRGVDRNGAVVTNVLEVPTIKIDKEAPTANETLSASVNNDKNVQITVSDIVETGSGLYGYYISENNTEKLNISESEWQKAEGQEIVISNPEFKKHATYYVWLSDKLFNISKTYEISIDFNYLVDGKITTVTLSEAIEKASGEENSKIELLNDYEDESIATFNKNVEFNLGTYTLTRTKTVTISKDKTVTINGSGNIVNNDQKIWNITNNGTLNVQGEVTLESLVSDFSYGAISSSSSSTLNVKENCTIRGVYRGITNNGTLNIEGGIVESTNNTSTSSCGIYNSSASYSKINITGGTVKGYYGINNDRGTVEINGGIIEGYLYGIENSSATLNVYDGVVYGEKYGIHGKATNMITIGKLDGEVSKETPKIIAKEQGIYMQTASHNWNFNSGVIKSDIEQTYIGNVVPRNGYVVYTFYNYDEMLYNSVLVPNVEEITFKQEPPKDVWTNQDVKVIIQYLYILNIYIIPLWSSISI